MSRAPAAAARVTDGLTATLLGALVCGDAVLLHSRRRRPRRWCSPLLRRRRPWRRRRGTCSSLLRWPHVRAVARPGGAEPSFKPCSWSVTMLRRRGVGRLLVRQAASSATRNAQCSDRPADDAVARLYLSVVCPLVFEPLLKRAALRRDQS